MAAKAVTIKGLLVTALALPDGTGSYTFDLSGSDQVHPAYVANIPKLPCVMLLDYRIARVPGAPMPSHTQTLRIPFLAYCEATADTLTARSDAALNLANDITLAVQDDRTLSGNAIAVELENLIPYAAVERNYGIVEGDIVITYRTTGGI